MRVRLAAVAATALFAGAVHVWGTQRLAAPPAEASLRVGIVQGSFATEVKWDDRYAEDMWAQQVRQSRDAVAQGAELVVWSEASLGLRAYYRYANRLKTLAKELGVPVVLGANYYHLDGDGYVQGVTNAAMAVHPDGSEDGPYDKRHLTPFGEYTPLKWLFPFLGNMIPAISAFDKGMEYRALQLNGYRAQPLICFESVFPHEVRAAMRDTQPDFLIHLTNVGWFGRTIMPEQDLAVARFRAVELGRPMVRAANTGISCIIDARGRLVAVAESEWGRVFNIHTLVGDMPLDTTPTVYARFGDLFVLACLGLVLLGGGLCYTRAARPS